MPAVHKGCFYKVEKIHIFKDSLAYDSCKYIFIFKEFANDY